MNENVNWVLHGIGLLLGLPTLYWLWKKISQRFWQSGTGTTLRSAGDFAAGSALALLCGLLWSLSYVSLKYVSGNVSVIAVAVAVLGWATLFLHLGRILFRRREHAKGESEQLLATWDTTRALLALLANLGNFGLSILALYFISATQAMTLNNMSPLFLMFILLVRGKIAIRPGVIAPLLLVLLGAWFLVADRSFHFISGETAIGSLIAVGAGISFAFWADRIEDVESDLRLTSTRLGFLSVIFFGSYTVAVTTGYLLRSMPVLGLTDQIILAANGLRVAVVYALFQLAVRRAGPLLATVVAVSQVPLTLGWEAILLGRPATTELVLGVLMITLGAATLYIVEFETRR